MSSNEQAIELVAEVVDALVTVPVAPWEKVRITGEQYVALTSSPEVLTAADDLKEALPFPLSLLLTPLMAQIKMRMIDAIVTYDEAEVEAAIRKHCPETAADFDAGLSPFESATRRMGLDGGEDDAA